MLKKKNFFYDEYYECYLCENNQILGHLWQEEMDEVEHLRHTAYRCESSVVSKTSGNNQKCLRRREREAWHALDPLPWSEKTTLQTMLIFIALNLKKFANWSWDSSEIHVFSTF